MKQDENNLESHDSNRRADERLIDALLLHLHNDRAVEDREQRVQRTLEALRQPARTEREPQHETTRHRWRFPRWARGAVGVAAMLLIIVGVWAVLYSPKTALASLDDIVNSLGNPGDRTYHIQLEELPEPPGKGSPDDQGSVPRPGLDDAKLYLRDGHAYLLVRHDPNGGLIFDGYDGRQSWRIRRGVVAETKEGPGAGGIPMPALMADVPFTDLHQTMERIRVDYTVEKLDEARLTAGGELLRYVRVRRNSHEVKGPQTIEIWADVKTAVPKRIVFDHAKLQGNRAPCRVTLDLVNEVSLAPDWFSPAAHVLRRMGHADDAPTMP